MTAYVIYQADVLDADLYAKYREKSPLTLADAGGKFIVRGGEIEVLEGSPPQGRTVVIEFESMNAARNWYYGKGYTETRRLRAGAAIANAYIIDGVN